MTSWWDRLREGCRRPALERRLRRWFAALPAPVRHRLRVIRLRLQTAPGRHAVKPVRVPGEGPVVALDARGVPWPEVAAAVEARSGRSERLVVLTDEPVMHVARELSVIVEYVPAASSADFFATRLAEIRRVYGVDRTEGLGPGRPDVTVVPC